MKEDRSVFGIVYICMYILIITATIKIDSTHLNLHGTSTRVV